MAACTVGLGVYSKTPMENAIRVCLNNLVDEIGMKLPTGYYRYMGKGQYTQQLGEVDSATQSTTEPD